MVIVIFTSDFEKEFKRIKNKDMKVKIIKQIQKLKNNPQLGKPMRYTRKGTRELYIGSFRLSYAYRNGKVIFLTIYHKDEQR